MPEAILKNPVKAIRAKCLDCCCGQANEVKECPITDCPLHAFRFGKNPYRKKRQISESVRTVLQAQALKNKSIAETKEALTAPGG